MKKLFNISIFFGFALLANIAHANTNEGKTNESNTPAEAKENFETNNVTKPAENESIDEQNAQLIPSVSDQEVQDTTDLNSVGKFNYIFYFIYKLKYDESEETSTEYLEYNF